MATFNSMFRTPLTRCARRAVLPIPLHTSSSTSSTCSPNGAACRSLLVPRRNFNTDVFSKSRRLENTNNARILVRCFSDNALVEDHFETLGLQRKYLISKKELDAAFRNKQKEFHPDKLAASNSSLSQEEAEAASAKINRAVKILRSPLERAQYWLELHGVKTLEAESRITDNALMMEMMEKYEELDDAGDEGLEQAKRVAEELNKENESKISEVELSIDNLITADEYSKVEDELNRLSLYLRLKEKIEQVLTAEGE